MLYAAQTQIQRWDEEARDETAVVPTGYDAFDNYLKRGGLRRGHLAGLLGRSGVGKTALACNVVARMAMAGVPVLFSSQEMSQPEVTNRLMAMAYGLPVASIEQKQRDGSLHSQWLEKYQEDFSSLVIEDSDEATFDSLSDGCTAFEAIVGIRPAVIVQDYLTLMSQNGLYGNEAVKVSRQARLMKGLAKDEDVAILTLVQTGRANEGDSTKRNHGHVPLTMEDAMHGGEQSFDVMFGLFRPELNPAWNDRTAEDDIEIMQLRAEWRNKAVFQVVKNRFGRTNFRGESVWIDWHSMAFWEGPTDPMERIAV